MIFIGEGALLVRAINYSARAGFAIDVVCCPPGDRAILSCRKIGAIVLETANPNEDLPPFLNQCSDGVAFSINNKKILGDRLLDDGVVFFNIHNGLVQWYRGVAEVCVFAALCRGERSFGVTLHRILPVQKVDAGPIVAQLKFEISDNHVFSDVMNNSLDACERIFELNVAKVISRAHHIEPVEVASRAYTYKDLARLCAEALPDNFIRACSLGPYAHYFPELGSVVRSQMSGLFLPI